MDSQGSRSTDIPILRTKMQKPLIRNAFVNRQTLIDKLETNVNLPLTLISAATGFGKSITASQWLENTSHNYGWISLDEEHNDISTFLRYLVSLMKAELPQKNFDLESLLQGTNLPSKIIASTLISDLDQLEDVFILVLDDYQIISNEKVHEIINGLLQYPPEYFHLVILTQRDPPLKLAKMRADLRLHELRMKDLSFSKDEALDLRTRIAAKTGDQQVGTLVEHTDGWVTGITAGLMVLADGVDFERVLQAVISQSTVISELLDEVVMTGMSVATQKFLELSVLPDRFSKELIDAMVAAIEDEDLANLKSEDFIRLSKLRNLFLIPLDATGQWYRYHHFFRDQLKNRTSKHFSRNTILGLYKAAGSWFEANDFLEEGLKYAILSEDMTFAVRLFDKSRNELFNTEQFQRLERLINLFPADVRNSHLELSISLAMLQDYKGNFPGMEEHLSEARLLIEDYSNQSNNIHIKKLKGELHSVSTFLPYILGNFDQCIIESNKCLELLPANQPNYFREFAIAYHVFAKQAQGNAKEGLSVLEENLDKLSTSDKYFRGRMLLLESMAYAMEGDVSNMRNSALRLTSLVEPQSLPGAWMAGIYYLTTSAYLTNKLEEVNRFHQELWKLRYLGRPFWVIHNFIIMGLASFAAGQMDKVKYLVDQCLELTSDLGIQPLEGMVRAFEVEVALRGNDIEQAIKLSSLANFEPHPPIFYYYYPQLTRVKLFFLTDRKEKGNELLKELLDVGRKRNNVHLLIQGLALQATMQANEANHKRAKTALNEALLLSKDKGLIRSFLDFGNPMYQLLRSLATDQPENDYIRELLHAFRNDRSSVLKKDQVSFGAKQHQLNSLSIRELEILNLVSKGYKNTEIAEKLFISLDTVKKHLYNTYQKLYAKNRVSAVKKARELGLIDLE